jgi:hypothetical protein
MLGKIVLRDGTEAILEDNGVWVCAQPNVQFYLNWLFNPRHAEGVSVLFPFGYITIDDAAQTFKAQAHHPFEIQPIGPDEIS